MTLVEKILAKKAGKKVVRPDELVEVSVDRAIPQIPEILNSEAEAKYTELKDYSTCHCERSVAISLAKFRT